MENNFKALGENVLFQEMIREIEKHFRIDISLVMYSQLYETKFSPGEMAIYRNGIMDILNYIKIITDKNS